jgi:hypothetical protein
VTNRQLVGFAVSIGLGLSLMFTYWLGPIIGYRFRLEWAVAGFSIVAFAWGIYYWSDFAKRRSD